jgi:hypothetical protein
MNNGDSDPHVSPAHQPAAEAPAPGRTGMSLAWMYGLVALALAAAIGFALLIVLPFYHRR